jgi:hypothetical protein
MMGVWLLFSIYIEYYMIVIGHHGIGTEIDGKDSGKCDQCIFNPLASMLIALPCVLIGTTEKSTPHTA